jgi:hypothetical protein
VRLPQTVDDGAEGVVMFDTPMEGRRVEAWVWGAAERAASGGNQLRSVRERGDENDLERYLRCCCC